MAGKGIVAAIAPICVVLILIVQLVNSGHALRLSELTRSRRSSSIPAEEEASASRALPELIALAHADKNFERALLRYLINVARSSSSYNGQTEVPSGIQQLEWQRIENEPQFLDGAQQENPLGRNKNLLVGLRSYPVSADNSLSGLESEQLNAEDLEQLAGPLSKREYRIKPCSFNAVSCAKNPFRASKL